MYKPNPELIATFTMQSDSDGVNYKIRQFVEDVTVIQLKFNTILPDRALKEFFKDRVFKYSKIVVEGIFLFNIYIMHLCEKNLNLSINANTIRRCSRLLLNGASVSRKINNGYVSNGNEIDIMQKLKKLYFNSNDFIDRNDIFVDDENATMKPIEHSCDAYFVNLKNHIAMNFKKYQKRYLMAKLKFIFSDGAISNSNLTFIIYAIQNRINGVNDYNYEVTKRKTKFDNIMNKSQKIHDMMNKFIKNEQEILKSKISVDIGKNKMLESVPDDKIIEYLKYFYLMLNELNKHGKKGFPLVPQFQPKIRFVMFDQRSMCAIYEKWKGVKIGTKKFSENYQMYFDEMFCIRKLKKYEKLLQKYPYIRSISTNGYAVSVTFEKLKEVKYIPKKKDDVKIAKPKYVKKEEPPKMDLETEYNKCVNNKKGRLPTLFTASEVTSTEEFLKQFNSAGNDIGNDRIFDITTKNGRHFAVHKNHYNDLAHITSNRKKLENYQKETGIGYIWEELSKCNTKTTNIKEYMKYVRTVRKHWKAIWKYCTGDTIFRLNFDSFVHKDMAVSKIAKEIIKEMKSKDKIRKSQLKYFMEEGFNQDKDKPILLAIGTGNGSGTITNTKGSSSKGCIKKLVKELSKYCLVILTPEDNTSKLCCKCRDYLESVDAFHLPKVTEYDKKNELIKKEDKIYLKEDKIVLIDERIKITKYRKHSIHICKKIIYREEKKGKNMDKDWIEQLKKQIEVIEDEVKELKCYRNSYRLRRCANKHPLDGDRCIMIERNLSASINILQMMKNIVIKGSKLWFEKKSSVKKDNYVKELEIVKKQENAMMVDEIMADIEQEVKQEVKQNKLTKQPRRMRKDGKMGEVEYEKQPIYYEKRKNDIKVDNKKCKVVKIIKKPMENIED